MSYFFTKPRLAALLTAAVIGSPITIAVAQNDSNDTATAGQDKAAIAVEAYDKADAGPKENWFGCPPVKGDTDADTASDNCEPSDRAPQADAKPVSKN